MLYHIDTDMGVDDALALILADRILANIAVLTTVVGNIPVSIATRNALLLRELLGRVSSWTVFQGADQAMCGYQPRAQEFHGLDGLAGATELLSERQMTRAERASVEVFSTATAPGCQDITLVGLGPATNIPDLVAWYGRSSVRRIVLMGGVFFDRGNVTPLAEFNVHADPTALRETLALGISTLIVPLDLTRKVQICSGALSIEGSSMSDLGRILHTSHRRYALACAATEGIEGFFPHDAVAVLAAAHPDRFHTVRGRVGVLVDGSKRGLTTLDKDESSHVEVALGGDLKWVRKTLYETLAAVV